MALHSHALPGSTSGSASHLRRQPLSRTTSVPQATSLLKSGCNTPTSSRRRPADRVGSRRGAQPIVAMQQPMMIPRTQDMAGDPFGLLLRQRIVFLGGEVNDFAADALISQLLLLDSTDPTKDIKLFINSPGGSVTAGMGIFDAMQMCNAEIQTFCFGLAASMGAFLLGAGAKGKRSSMPNARIMIHQPLGGASGQAVDIEIQAREIMYHKANINRIMADYTGQPIEKLEDDTDRDRYMSPLEAKQYGLIDHIIGGDTAGFEIKGSPTDFPKTRPEYIRWGEELEEEMAGRGSRFKGVPLEPHTKPLDNERKSDD